MKNIFKLVLLFLVSSSFFISCKKDKSLSELRHEEKIAIQKYIQDSAIQVINEFPTDTIFQDKQFYLSPTGLYIHISKKGYGGVPKTGDNIIVRYYEFDLQGDTTVKAMNASEERDPSEFKYEKGQACEGFIEAVGYMQHEGEAELIIPSAIGFSQTAQQTITPYRYQIKIKIE